MNQSEFEDLLRGDDRPTSVALEIDQVWPPFYGPAGLVRVRPECVSAATQVFSELDASLKQVLQLAVGSNLGLTHPELANATCLRIYLADERLAVGYANFYWSVKAFAPYLEDARFFAHTWNDTSAWVDEYRIHNRELTFGRERRGNSLLDYYRRRAAAAPTDEPLQQFLTHMESVEAEIELDD